VIVRVVLDHDRVVQPVPELANPRLEQALLVLRRVVLEVLGEVTERAGGLDRLDGGEPLRALEIGKLGLKVTPSVANFILIHFTDAKGRTASDANAFLMKRGLVVRQVGAYKLPNALRMLACAQSAVSDAAAAVVTLGLLQREAPLTRDALQHLGDQLHLTGRPDFVDLLAKAHD